MFPKRKKGLTAKLYISSTLNIWKKLLSTTNTWKYNDCWLKRVLRFKINYESSSRGEITSKKSSSFLFAWMMWLVAFLLPVWKDKKWTGFWQISLGCITLAECCEEEETVQHMLTPLFMSSLGRRHIVVNQAHKFLESDG